MKQLRQRNADAVPDYKIKQHTSLIVLHLSFVGIHRQPTSRTDNLYTF